MLLTERGIRRYGLFDEVGEGTLFPDGTEAMSGHVVDEHGDVYFFWTGWDQTENRPIFVTWERIGAEPSWLRSAEFRQALEEAGRSPTPRT